MQKNEQIMIKRMFLLQLHVYFLLKVLIGKAQSIILY